MRKYLYTLLLLSVTASAYSQPHQEFWRKTEFKAASASDRFSIPIKYQGYALNEADLQRYLDGRPFGYEHAVVLDLPTPEGSLRAFRVWRTMLMEPALAAKAPEISTYSAEAVGASYITAKLDCTPLGFHALVFDGGNTYLIDPPHQTADGVYVVYYQGDAAGAKKTMWSCGVTDVAPAFAAALSPGTENRAQALGNIQRSYRMALSCTGEYATSTVGVNGTKAQVLAAMVTLQNRVNGIYERELACTFQLVAGELNIIYLDKQTDPFDFSGNLFIQNQTNTDQVIGAGNYDIGHLLTGVGGGFAMFSLCTGTSQASGYSGGYGSAAQNYLLMGHELGHQFAGLSHTFNSGMGGCLNNGVVPFAVEPNSGSSLMGYPGSCNLDNIQTDRDNYFHTRLFKMADYYLTNFSTCHTVVSNSGISVSLPTIKKTYAIPFRTPFELTAPAATAAKKDTSITYEWEEIDLGNFGQSLSSYSVYGPLFRSYPPDTSRTRVFPNIKSIIGKRPLNGEKLPDSSRTMLFQVAARNMYHGWGAVSVPDDSLILNVIDTKTPFSVTSPKGLEVWGDNALQDITWNVSGTTAAPVSCPRVDIYLSTDSGYTYPILVLANTPNDGSERVKMPSVNTLAAKIKVKCSNNVFFNVSDKYFSLFSTAGLTGTSLAEAIKISPVPASNLLQIEAPSALGTVRFQMVNMLGQVVDKGAFHAHFTKDVSRLPKGVYQLMFQCERGISTVNRVIID